MLRSTRAALAATLATFAVATPVLALDTPTDGYELTALAYPGSGPLATLSSGDFLLFDGSSITRYDSSGAFQQTLVTFPSFVFPSFAIVDPSESFLVVGESSTQDVLKVDLGTGAVTPLANIAFNYDAAFDSPSSVIVSGLGTSAIGNQLIRVDTDTGASTVVCDVTGFSGPVACDANGDLYYVTFPSPTADVVRWDASQLTGAPVLDTSDATVLSTGFLGGASIQVDPTSGDVFVAENVFSTGANTLLRVGPTRATSEELVTGTLGFSLSNLELVEPTGGAVFAPFQPEFGGALRYSTNDFAGTIARNRVRPDRPEVALTGPGAVGAGAFAVELTGAPTSGVAVFVFGAQSLYSPVELPYLFGGQPVLSGIDVGTAIIGPIVSTGASGAASLAYFNNGSLIGTAAIQAICVDPLLGIVGSSSTAFL